MPSRSRRGALIVLVACLAAVLAAPTAGARPLDTTALQCIRHPEAAGRAQPARADDLRRHGREELSRWMANHPRLVAAGRARAVVTIPVAFHVIRKDTTATGGNVTRARILDQIAVLNDSFSGRTGGVETGFRFSLASVSRTTSKQWYSLNGYGKELAMKEALKVGGPETLNIYSARLVSGLFGWAYLAEDVDEIGVLDGVVINHRTVPGGDFGIYSEGDTTTHEVGHWLNLEHTFQGGCEGPGDFVADTAPEASPAYGCPVGRDTCPGGGPDPTTNFMDYTDDPCMWEFTAGQTARMGAAWTAYRAP